MPHIKLEHTENIDPDLFKPVFKKLKVILIKNAGVKKDNCKCKAIQIPIYEVGSDDASEHFYHLEISLLKGRSEEVRGKIGKKSLQILRDYFVDEKGENVKRFSVEIREINPSDYLTSNTL